MTEIIPPEQTDWRLLIVVFTFFIASGIFAWGLIQTNS